MKKCDYCGRENDEDAVQCRECGTEFPQDKPSGDAPTNTDDSDYEFVPLSAEESKQDLVELARCRTLIAADLLVGRLEAAGIPAFIPDQFLMQAVAWNLNTYGYVRVQVSPKDYESARELISAVDPRSQS